MAVTAWEKYLLFGGLAAVFAWIIWGKIRELRANRHPDAQRMKRLVEEVRYYLEHRTDPKRAEAEGLGQPKLSAELIRGIENGLKLLVLCEASEHPDLEVPPRRRCAVFLVLKDHSHLRLAASGQLERTARTARELGKLLELPVEMV